MKKSALANLLLSVVMILTLVIMPMCIYAEENYSLTIKYVSENEPIYGATYKIYRALDSEGKLTGDFADYHVMIGDLYDSEEMGIISETLSAYAARDKIKPAAEGVTNSKGEVTFSGLEKGIYLVVGSYTRIGDMLFMPMPCLVTVPYYISDTEYEADVTVNAKFGVRSAGTGTLEYTVEKVWMSDKGIGRPHEVTVQMLMDGEVFSTVTLNEENNWKFTWRNLPADYKWQVSELDIPEGYYVSIALNNTTYYVTNTFMGDDSSITDENDPTNPSNTDSNETDENTTTDETTGTDFDDPSESTSGSETGTDETTNSSSSSGSNSSSNNTKTTTPTVKPPGSGSGGTSTLPQTGQLWWPVPILFIAGALILLAGIIDRSLDRDEKA